VSHNKHTLVCLHQLYLQPAADSAPSVSLLQGFFVSVFYCFLNSEVIQCSVVVLRVLYWTHSDSNSYVLNCVNNTFHKPIIYLSECRCALQSGSVGFVGRTVTPSAAGQCALHPCPHHPAEYPSTASNSPPTSDRPLSPPITNCDVVPHRVAGSQSYVMLGSWTVQVL